MKYNREQIVKALECCTEQEYCATCPATDYCKGMDSLIEDAATLIKELTEESYKWQEAYDCADSACRELSSKCDEFTEENKRFRHNHEKLIEERDTFREYAYNMQKYVENIRHKEEAGYEPSAARYAAEMEMWHIVALEKKELTEENKTLNSLVKVLSENNADLEDELAKTYDLLEESKADTIQKMQEKIRAKSEYGTINISPWQLDQIAKEMLEENK